MSDARGRGKYRVYTILIKKYEIIFCGHFYKISLGKGQVTFILLWIAPVRKSFEGVLKFSFTFRA